jgi:LytR cell envelope-related transcriptional attenuator
MARPMGGRRPGSDSGVQWLKALLLIVVLVVIGVVILAKTGTSKSTHTAGSTRTTTRSSPSTTVLAPTTTTTVLPASQVKVQVLNGLLTGSLASQWSTKLKSQFGYQTGLPDDATVKTTSSIIFILTPGYTSEAYQLATNVGLPSTAVNTTTPAPATAPIRASERSTANLVLVIGQDLAGSA